MKKSIFSVLAIIALLAVSCSKKDSSDNIDVENYKNGNAWTVTETETPSGTNSNSEAPPQIDTTNDAQPLTDVDVNTDVNNVDVDINDQPLSFAKWIEILGIGRQTKQCITLSQCLKNPNVNILYSNEDRDLNVFADCADLPIILRAYYAYKTKQVFSYVNDIEGGRYSVGNYPSRYRNYTQFSSVKKLFIQIANSVHSGFFRTAPNVEKTDTYPIKISRETVKPGTVFYDPNGHVLVVYKVEDNGTVRMMDGHPDNSLTIKRFNESFAQGRPSNGGGFRAWRNYHIEGSLENENLRIVRDLNKYSKGFDDSQQYQRYYTLSNGTKIKYHQWVRMMLSKSGSKLDPIREFKERVEALCTDIDDRITAVNSAVKANISRKDHPNKLPDNIYGTYGEWETWSSPSRDARLKASFEGLYKFIKSSIKNLHTNSSEVRFSGSSYILIRKYKHVWDTMIKSGKCNYEYTNSANTKVGISLETVMERLWKISFDPYHCPELRWGAPLQSEEYSSCEYDSLKLSWYEKEQRLRNNIDRVYDAKTTIDFGPNLPVDVDINKLISYYLRTIVKPDREPEPEPTPIYDNPLPTPPTPPQPPVINSFYCKVTHNDPRHGGAPIYDRKSESWNNIVASAFLGDRIKVMFFENNWAKIQYNGQNGWVKRNHMSNCNN